MTDPDRGNSSEQTGCEPSENDHMAPAPPSAGQTFRGFLRDALETVVPAIIIALLVTHFVGQFTYVQSQSMVPHLYPDHRLIIEKISYRFHGPQRGDIVVFDLEGAPIALIKRVIGLPGETVEIRNNQVWINGEPLDEPYLANGFQRDYGPATVPPLHVLVMGDNRPASHDSRAFGPVPIEAIRGKASVRLWPWEKIGVLK